MHWRTRPHPNPISPRIGNEYTSPCSPTTIPRGTQSLSELLDASIPVSLTKHRRRIRIALPLLREQVVRFFDRLDPIVALGVSVDDHDPEPEERQTGIPVVAAVPRITLQRADSPAAEGRPGHARQAEGGPESNPLCCRVPSLRRDRKERFGSRDLIDRAERGLRLRPASPGCLPESGRVSSPSRYSLFTGISRVPAGSFRYRWGEESDAVLSTALDLSRTRAVGVQVGRRTFVAPVGSS